MVLAASRLGFQILSFSPNPSPFIRPKSIKPFPRSNRKSPPSISSSVVEQQDISFTDSESRLIEALLGIQGRGRAATPQQLKDVEDAVQALEPMKGVLDPTSTGLIEGRWQLIFTTRPGTASPIQRTFVGVDIFKIFQEVYLRTDDPRVSNVVIFSDAIGELKVEAEAKIEDGKRILFRFDRAAFSFKFLPFKVPYPVPFKLLGDEAKGWLDTTYLSQNGNIRISRGSKGTTFVLQKKIEPRQKLLSAISGGTGIREAIDELVSLNWNKVDQEFETLEGEWQLLWASQLEDESWSSIIANGLKGFQIVKKGGQLENQVDVFPSVKLQAMGNLIKEPENSSYSGIIHNGAVSVGSLKFPLNIHNKFNMDLLYIDEKIRITRGSNEILFVHLRLTKN
ncbi:Plastid lipid-associated protein/fibrillin conserved domain-containing protein [Dioscorea alata]|uniref:Plastid lipid-associated protein/fibrillin conserved domain-containing protein n=1 Tax=Dioscorea alata TaxID=55571 RepID=A0ACB7TZZ9_DIOAL|nr:Plastid lipid-associated protein/fibrillin conserved domain-containing protein [Dioscorea alata]